MSTQTDTTDGEPDNDCVMPSEEECMAMSDEEFYSVMRRAVIGIERDSPIIGMLFHRRSGKQLTPVWGGNWNENS